ncbi:MAG TPA: hypothetical protein VF480_11385 [Verrucomicrobiae bacterium]
MKTPREILLARHQAAAPKLDAIRHDVVNAEFNAGQASRLFPSGRMKKSETGATPFLRLLWQELVLPSRRIWAGLAAVWVLIFVFDFSQRDPSERMAQKSPPPSPEMILTFRQQERLLTELIGPNEPQAVAPAKPFLPQPRSEGRIEILMT